MTPIKIPYSNITYTAEGCHDLPATLVQLPDGHEEVETVWELTDEEIEQIVRDRRIYLYIIGRSGPPVCLATEPCIEIEQEGGMSHENQSNTDISGS